MRRSKAPLVVFAALGLVAAIAWWLLAPAPSREVEALPEAVPAPKATRRADGQTVFPTMFAEGGDEGMQDVAGWLTPPDAGAPPVAVRPAVPQIDAGDEAVSAQQFFAKNAEVAQKVVDRFCDESKRIKKAGLGPAADAKPSRDAATYLMVRVGWENTQRPQGLLQLPDALRQRLRSYGADWHSKITDADLAGLDFSWLDALKQFDHWTLLGDGPARDAVQPTFSTAPIPNLIGFQEWAKLRFAAALRKGDFAAASAQIRHLVTLLHTTGMLIAEAITVVLLGYEATAFEVAKARGLDLGPFQPYARDDLRDYRRTSFAAMGLLFPGVDPAIAKKALTCAVNPCMAIFEATGFHAELGHFSAVDTTPAFNALADSAGCDPRQLQWLRRVKPGDLADSIRNITGAHSLERYAADAGR